VKRFLKSIALLVAMLMMVSVFTVACSQKAEEAKTSSESKKEEVKQEEPKKEESKKEEANKGLDWPKKTIQIIVPFNPGGDTDFNARTYAKYLEKELGQSLVVVNVSGNGGTVGSRKVKDAKPDGYTVLFYHTAMQVNEASGMVDYGFKDFEIAGIAAKNPGDIITVSKDSPYKTLKDLVEASKKNPGQIKIAGNTGATTYLTGTMLNASGAQLNIVDSGGATDRIAALKGGHIDAIPNPYGTVKPYLESGDFRALAVITEERNPKFPDIPTAKEQGYDVVLPIAYFFAFPKGTPEEIVDKFSKAVEKIATTNKEYAEAIDKAYHQAPFYLNREEGYKWLDEQRNRIMALQDKLILKK
jgi:tripartite-type tricarboxylate transporter receptor subunit TctC